MAKLKAVNLVREATAPGDLRKEVTSTAAAVRTCVHMCMSGREWISHAHVHLNLRGLSKQTLGFSKC